MTNATQVLKAFVALWRAEPALTDIPIFPEDQVVAGNIVSYATIQLRPGQKYWSTAPTFLQYYHLRITVYASDSKADIRAIDAAIDSAINERADAVNKFLEPGVCLLIRPVGDQEELGEDTQHQAGKLVNRTAHNWTTLIQQNR